MAILHGEEDEEIRIVNLIKKRNSELFGHIATEILSIRLIQSEGTDLIIIRCKLEGLDNILSTIALSYPPLTTLDMSGTLKRLRKRLSKKLTKVNTMDCLSRIGDEVSFAAPD